MAKDEEMTLMASSTKARASGRKRRKVVAARAALRSVAGGNAALAKPASAAAGDDTEVTALALAPAALSAPMAAYFAKCEEKLGFVPNVLKAYAFDMAKLEPFVAMYNDLMLAPSGLSKLEREMIAVAVSAANRCYYCLVAHGAAVRALAGDPVLGELMVMNYRAARLDRRQRAMLDFAVKLTAEPWAVEEEDRARLRRAGFSDRDIWDIAAVAGFFNMSNRVASATDMRPNSVYHGQARGCEGNACSVSRLAMDVLDSRDRPFAARPPSSRPSRAGSITALFTTARSRSPT